jgi:hypothetical protein
VEAKMSLSDLANLVEIVGIFAILFGIIFGVLQIRQNRIQRRDLAILECAHLFEDEQFAEAFRLLSELPNGMTQAQFAELDEKYESAAIRAAMKFETIGILVHRGVVPLSAMEELVSGAALAIWRILQPWIEELRVKRSYPTYWEWYQWLVERLEERQSQERSPAFMAYADWKEPKL